MSDNDIEAEILSVKELVLRLHSKIDTLLHSMELIASDRLDDRIVIVSHDRRIERLEHQIALLPNGNPLSKEDAE